MEKPAEVIVLYDHAYRIVWCLESIGREMFRAAANEAERTDELADWSRRQALWLADEVLPSSPSVFRDGINDEDQYSILSVITRIPTKELSLYGGAYPNALMVAVSYIRRLWIAYFAPVFAGVPRTETKDKRLCAFCFDLVRDIDLIATIVSQLLDEQIRLCHEYGIKPHPPFSDFESHPPVVFNDDGSVTVRGVNKGTISVTQAKIVKLLMKHRPARLTGPKLSLAGCGDDPGHALRDLKEEDQDWEAVLLFPINRNDGYGIR